MTDPLSVVASIVAVVTAAGAVVKAIEKARRLTKCSTALLSLRNQVKIRITSSGDHATAERTKMVTDEWLGHRSPGVLNPE